MKKVLKALKIIIVRNVYLYKKLIKDRQKIIVIYNRNHPIYTSIFEHEELKRYKFVYINLNNKFSFLERMIFNKAEIIHADGTASRVGPFPGKIVVVETENRPTPFMLNDDSIKKIYLFSRAAAPDLVGTHPKVEVLYPAIRVRESAQPKVADSNKIVLTSVGYGSIRKGYDVLFRIYETLKEKYPVHLVIAGSMGHDWAAFPEITKETYDRANFPEIEQKLKADPNAVMKIVRNQELLSSILPAADIYIHLCRLESFGYSVLEAMNFGLPVVSTRQWAMPEIVANGVTGFLVNDFTDDINSDAWFQKTYKEGLEAVTRLIEDVNLRKQMGMAGISRIKEVFDMEKKKTKLEADYDALLSHKKKDIGAKNN